MTAQPNATRAPAHTPVTVWVHDGAYYRYCPDVTFRAGTARYPTPMARAEAYIQRRYAQSASVAVAIEGDGDRWLDPAAVHVVLAARGHRRRSVSVLRGGPGTQAQRDSAWWGQGPAELVTYDGFNGETLVHTPPACLTRCLSQAEREDHEFRASFTGPRE